MMIQMFKDRIYKSGTGIKWCFWRWSDAQEPYLRRLFIFKTPWLSLSYNHIKEADVGHPHDHTATFFSLFLRGWYYEKRLLYQEDEDMLKLRKLFYIKRRFFNYVRASSADAHRIIAVAPTGAHTLCFMGPKKREWYYHTPLGKKHWKEIKNDSE